MHRLITALMALVSLLTANLYSAGAQQSENKQPPPFPVGQAQRPNPRLSEQALRPLATDDHFLKEERRPYELAADQTVPYLVTRDKTLLLAGHVVGDVLTINCHVVIKPGASVGNVLTAVGGDVVDENQGRVRFTQQSADLISDLQPEPAVATVTIASSLVAPHTQVTLPSTENMRHGKQKDDWAGGQFALMLLGGLAGLLALIVAPRATERTGESLTQEPGRCLVVGVLGAGAMLIGLWFSSGLMSSSFHFIWMPFAAGFAGLCLGALAFGWICGMRFLGQRLARRLGRSGGIGLWIQIALGLGAFFLANVVLGRINQGLGIVGLLLEFALALAGLGAALLTGFGSDPNWLTARMRGESRWLSRTPRL